MRQAGCLLHFGRANIDVLRIRVLYHGIVKLLTLRPDS
jgi:hypothetical protein